MEHLLLTVSAALGGVILLYSIKTLKLRYMLLSAVCGFTALIAADLICGFFDFNLPINAFSVSLSAIGGLPGVILLNAMNAIFGKYG